MVFGCRMAGGRVVILCLELNVELYAYAPFVDVGLVAVGQSVYIVNAQHFENIRNSYSYFHVWHRAKIVLFVILIRELEQVAGILWVGAVLLAQVSEHSAE